MHNMHAYMQNMHRVKSPKPERAQTRTKNWTFRVLFLVKLLSMRFTSFLVYLIKKSLSYIMRDWIQLKNDQSWREKSFSASVFAAVWVWAFLNIFRLFFHFSTPILKPIKKLSSEINTQLGSMIITMDEQHSFLNQNLTEWMNLMN